MLSNRIILCHCSYCIFVDYIDLSSAITYLTEYNQTHGIYLRICAWVMLLRKYYIWYVYLSRSHLKSRC